MHPWQRKKTISKQVVLRSNVACHVPCNIFETPDQAWGPSKHGKHGHRSEYFHVSKQRGKHALMIRLRFPTNILKNICIFASRTRISLPKNVSMFCHMIELRNNHVSATMFLNDQSGHDRTYSQSSNSSLISVSARWCKWQTYKTSYQATSLRVNCLSDYGC